jgi:hypothetical protein
LLQSLAKASIGQRGLGKIVAAVDNGFTNVAKLPGVRRSTTKATVN